MAAPRFSFDYAVGGYLRAHMVSRYLFSTGKLTVPVMGKTNYPAAANTTESVQVSSPWGFLVRMFDVARMRAKPRVPNPVCTDTNLELVGGEINVAAPLILTDSVTYLYQVTGIYYYRCLRPVWTSEGFCMGSSVIDSTPGQGNILDAKQFAVPADSTMAQQLQLPFGLSPRPF